MDAKPPKGDRKSPGISPNKVKLREGKDKSSMSRIKKLKRRISASFSRLSISKDSIPERGPTEVEDQPANGHRTMASCSSREISQSPPVFYSLNGTPDHKPVPHPLHNMGQSLDESQLQKQLNANSQLKASLSAQLPNYGVPQYNGHHHDYVNISLSHYNNGYNSEHSSSQPHINHDSHHHYQSHHQYTDDPSRGVGGSSQREPPSHQQHNQYHYQQLTQADFPPPPTEAYDNYTHAQPHPAGDMLNNDIEYPSPVVPRRDKSRRPKSEGNFYVEAFRSKRASSFGYNSPFGKEEAYEKLEQLGEGSYATVYKGVSLLTNKVVALKEIRLQPEEGTPFTAIREASLLKGLKHCNIVTLHDIIHTKDTLTFVFEYVHTDLSQYLEKHTGGLNPRNVKLFLFQLLRGLAFCHERRILHRDLKPQNLLISEIGELKLADFGLARAKSVPSRTYSHEVVTLWYRPPDVLLGSTDYSTSLDIWGVGCIFTEMVSGVATFPGMKDTWDQLDRIWRVLGTPTEDVWPGVTDYPHYCREKFGLYLPQSLSRVIPKLAHIPYAEILAQELLQLQPKKRISAKNALHHKYFSDLPQAIHDIDSNTSIFDIPGIKLAPEMDEFLRTRICTNPHMKNKVL